MEIVDNKVVEQQKRQPPVETHMMLSQDGKWFIHKTTITDIKSVNYVRQVLKL